MQTLSETSATSTTSTTSATSATSTTSAPSTPSTQESQKSVYRFKFSDLVSEELHNFAKQYRFTPRKDVKEAWKRFTQGEIMSQLINQEKERLGQSAYEGDIISKMYTSMRYYYMKLPNTAEPSYRKEQPQEPQQQEQQEQPQKARKRREYSHKEYKLTKEDHGLLNTYLQNNSVLQKPSEIWDQFKAQYTHYQDNACIKKSLFNKIYILKLKQKQGQKQGQHPTN